MIGIFNKPIMTVDKSDIDELIQKTWPEDYHTEYKRGLPSKNSNHDPQIANSMKISDYARDTILAEIVAFANAAGGTLIIGITETATNPPRADKISPLSGVGELATRFEDQARSCIDPQLPNLAIQPVVTDELGGGVIVFRVPASRLAPHRLSTSKESFVRRGSSTMKMTMREIQAMTIDISRGLAEIDSSFKCRRSAFHSWAKKIRTPKFIAYRVTAVPMTNLPDPGRLFNRRDLFPHPRQFPAQIGRVMVNLPFMSSGFLESPRLRGVARTGTYSKGNFIWELYQSGVTNFVASVLPNQNHNVGTDKMIVLNRSHILGAVANTFAVIKNFRDRVGAPESEYALEVEIKTVNNIELFSSNKIILNFSSTVNDYSGPMETIEDSNAILPRISVLGSNEFGYLMTLIDIDIHDSLCVNYITESSTISIDI